MRETSAELAEIPRWPMGKYALRLAQLGEFENALEMVTYNRHFQPADMELIRMEAVLQAIVAKLPAQARRDQGMIAA